METSVLSCVMIACPKDKVLISSRYTGTTYDNHYKTDHYSNEYRVKSFNVPVDIQNSYEQDLLCPHCGEKLALTVKSKGKLTDTMRQSTLKETHSDMKTTYISLPILLVVTAVLIVLGAVLMKFNLRYFFLFVPATLTLLIALFMIPAALRMLKFIKHPERIPEQYDKDNPYFISLQDGGHFFATLNKDFKTQMKWFDLPTSEAYLKSEDDNNRKRRRKSRYAVQLENKPAAPPEASTRDLVSKLYSNKNI